MDLGKHMYGLNWLGTHRHACMDSAGYHEVGSEIETVGMQLWVDVALSMIWFLLRLLWREVWVEA
jgi:hypothetical protein